MVFFPLLSSIILLPMFGALIAFLIKGEDKESSKNIQDLALWITFTELLLVIFIILQFDINNKEFQFVERTILLSKYQIIRVLGTLYNAFAMLLQRFW